MAEKLKRICPIIKMPCMNRRCLAFSDYGGFGDSQDNRAGYCRLIDVVVMKND